MRAVKPFRETSVTVLTETFATGGDERAFAYLRINLPNLLPASFSPDAPPSTVAFNSRLDGRAWSRGCLDLRPHEQQG